MQLKAILFDLGDTLLDFAPVDTMAVLRRSARTAYDFLQARGHALPPVEQYHRTLAWALRWSYIWARLRGRELNILTELRKVCQRLQIHIDEPTLVELNWILYAPAVEHSSIEDDLVTALTTLRARGLKLGLISNTVIPGILLDRHIQLAGLYEFFPVRIYSSEVGFRKPDKRIFKIALDQLGVTAGEAMFVGDLVRTDIRGARRAGLRAVLKQPRHNGQNGRAADHVIRRISELLELVEPINGQARTAARAPAAHNPSNNSVSSGSSSDLMSITSND